MAGVNWGSILKKAQACMNTPEKKAEASAKIDAYMMSRVGLSFGSLHGSGGKAPPKPPSLAAGKFIEILEKEIQSHVGGSYASGGMSQAAMAALSNISHSEPYRVGDTYYVDVFINGDLSRPSLAPEHYDGIDNIAALLNNGYTASHRVYGVWEGHSIGDERIASLTSRGGAHFVQQAVRDFMSNYASEYGVINIQVSDVYS